MGSFAAEPEAVKARGARLAAGSMPLKEAPAVAGAEEAAAAAAAAAVVASTLEPVERGRDRGVEAAEVNRDDDDDAEERLLVEEGEPEPERLAAAAAATAAAAVGRGREPGEVVDDGRVEVVEGASAAGGEGIEEDIREPVPGTTPAAVAVAFEGGAD